MVRNQTVVGVCPEANDLCVSKLCAFREKDRDFVGALLLAGIVDVRTLLARIGTVPGIHPTARDRATGWLNAFPGGGHVQP